jgi:tRNA (cmo5U34)-methyltransferase
MDAEEKAARALGVVREGGTPGRLPDMPEDAYPEGATPLEPLPEEDDPTTALAPESGRWEFDAAVTSAFDDMLEKSIPNYGDMRKITTDAAAWVLDRCGFSGTKFPGVVDLGASRGAALQPIIDVTGARARYLACDISDPMLDALRARFTDWPDDVIEVRKHDLRDGFPVFRAQPMVVLSVLTLQFVPIEYRQTLLRGVYEALGRGGALILVEKVLGEADETNRLLADLYWGLKRENGYAQEAIERKAMALEGVLVPLTADFNEQLLRRSGFDLVEVVWAWANFRAWLAVKR